MIFPLLSHSLFPPSFCTQMQKLLSLQFILLHAYSLCHHVTPEYALNKEENKEGKFILGTLRCITTSMLHRAVITWQVTVGESNCDCGEGGVA